MPKARQPRGRNARLVGIYLPRMQIHHRWLPFSFIKMMYSPCSQFVRKQSKVSTTRNRYIVAEEPKRRGGEFPNLSPTLQSFDIRKTWSIWDTVVVVDDGKYTGVVFKSFFTKDFESPQGLGCNRIARRAETGYRRSRDIFYNSPRTPQVIAKIRLVAVVNHLMRVSVASDAVACLTDRLNQPWSTVIAFKIPTATLSSSLTQQNNLKAFEYNLQIEKRRHIFNVVQIILEFFYCIFFTIAVRVADLSPARDARLN